MGSGGLDLDRWRQRQARGCEGACRDAGWLLPCVEVEHIWEMFLSQVGCRCQKEHLCDHLEIPAFGKDS